jgi:hypothetical protein
LDGRAPARRVASGEVRGEGRSQGLTTVRLHPVSRAVVVGRVDLDENPRWWRRGSLSMAMLRQTASVEDLRMSFGESWEAVGAINWKLRLRIRGYRWRQ